MNHKRIFLSPPHLDGNELSYLREAVASNYIAPHGPMIDRLEEAISRETKIPHACALSSATAALDLIYAELDIQRGDTVFCQDLTFIASIAPAVHRGATPLFIDSDPRTWTMDPELLKQALADAAAKNRLPKAVTAVDLYGQCCDYAKIVPICEEYGVPLVADAAEAMGSKFRDADNLWRHAGDAGYAAAFSFNGNKIITSSGGGMLVSRSAKIVDTAKFLAQQARDAFPWYQHSTLGYNYRMSNIVAAIGLAQLECLHDKVSRKRKIFSNYTKLLADADAFSFMPEADYCQSNRWLTVVTVDKAFHKSPEELRIALEEFNIEARPVWKPMHMQPVFAGARRYGGSVAEKLFQTGLCLPSGAALSEDEQCLIVDRIRK